MDRSGVYDKDELVNLKATELRLGLPGTDDGRAPCSKTNKRVLPDSDKDTSSTGETEPVPPPKAQIVGWPPVRSSRKKSYQESKKNEAEGQGMFVKVSMEGAPYLRKIDLRVYKGYPELLKSLETMFKFSVGKYLEREGYKGSDYVPTYEDKDGDWMLVGDVPWQMFASSCKKLRIVKG